MNLMCLGLEQLSIRKPSEICLVRHGYSTKNEEDRHGGDGLLTPRGRKEIERAYFRIEAFYRPLNHLIMRIYSSSSPQVLSSAKILSRRFHVNISVDPRIEPLDLGVLSGLSIEEAKARYPGSASRLQEWRDGKREITQLYIPRSENLKEFWQRGVDFIHDLGNLGGLSIVMGTRSILTLLINIMLGHSINRGDGYCAIEVPTGGIASFKGVQGKWQVRSKQLWDVRLVQKQKKDS